MLGDAFEHFVAVGQGTMKKIKDFKIRKTARKWFGGTTGVYYYTVLIDFRVPWSITTKAQKGPSSMAVGKTDPAKNTPEQHYMVFLGARSVSKFKKNDFRTI